jgi:hypothetical protein
MGILQFALVALGLFYLVIAIYSILRIIKVSTSKNRLNISIAFYAGMLIASLSRSITLYLISINVISNNPKDTESRSIFVYTMLIIPDMANICVYLFLIWYFYANLILSHINLANDISLFTHNDEPTISRKTYLILYIMLPVYFIVFVIVCALTFAEVINDESLFLINSCFSVATPILFLGYYIFLLIKFSGRPYYGDSYKYQIRKILIIVIIWSVSRFVSGILGLVVSGNFIENIIKDFPNKSNDMLYSVTILVYFLVTEYIPDFFALDFSFMMTYIKIVEAPVEEQLYISDSDKTIIANSENTSYNSRKLSLTSNPKNDSNLHYNVNNFNPNMNKFSRNSNYIINSSRKKVNDIMIKKFEDIQLNEQIFKKKNGLGIIYKSTYHLKDFACRVIKNERLSRYDLEGLSKDLDDLM